MLLLETSVVILGRSNNCTNFMRRAVERKNPQPEARLLYFY